MRGDDSPTLFYVHKNEVIHQSSAQYVVAYRRKMRETVTDGGTETRTDGHHHTIKGHSLTTLTFQCKKRPGRIILVS